MSEKITILGIEYEIERVPCISKDEFLLGQIDYIRQKILIDGSISEEKAQVVLLHEIIHGILEALGMNDENQNETMIQGLAAALYVCFKSNLKLPSGSFEKEE